MPTKPAAFPICEELLDNYLGIYEGDGDKIEFKKENDSLFLILDDEYTLPVYPISEDSLHHTWIDEEYTFTKDDDGHFCLWG